MTGPRILTLDIETSPLQSYHWGLWKQNISLNQIQNEWTVLSFCAKWTDSKAVIYDDVRYNEDKRDDWWLLNELWHLLDEADFVIAQNGKQFDLKKIKARMIMAGFPPFSPVVVIDTMLIAKDVFGFTSNKLEWMTTHLTETTKLKHKAYPGFDLWTACLAGDMKAWEEMEAYNIVDVKSTEELYFKLRPWAISHPNIANFYPDEEPRCPKCASEDLKQRGYAYTNTGQYHRYQCGACGGWSRSRYTINTIGKRRSLMSN